MYRQGNRHSSVEMATEEARQSHAMPILFPINTRYLTLLFGTFE